MVVATVVAITGCGLELDGNDEKTATSESIQALTAGRHAPCLPGVTCVDMHFVAHQDDDILFMNPDIRTSIANGNHVVTIFLTAGTSTYEAYDPMLQNRELGSLNAYAYMVDPSYSARTISEVPAMLGHWQLYSGMPISIATTNNDGSSASKQAIRYEWMGSPAQISLIFLRLNQDVSDLPQVKTLWTGAATTVDTVPCTNNCPLGSTLGSQPYDKSNLTGVLKSLISQFHTSGTRLLVSTQDSTGIYSSSENFGIGWGDYPDHTYGARFVLAAFHRHHQDVYQNPNDDFRSVREYRDYDISMEPTNLGTNQILEKRKAVCRYEKPLGGTCNVDNPDYSCPANPVNPSCDAEFDNWTTRKYDVITLASANPLRGRLMTRDWACLRADAGSLAMGSCTGAPEWQITTRNEIKLGSDTSKCLILDANGITSLGTCLSYAQADLQTMVLTSNGQIRTKDAKCLGNSGASISSTDCLGTFDAYGNPNRQPVYYQDWTLLLSDPVLIPGSGQFGDSSEVDNYRSYYRTITIADGQICLRRPSGVGCAAYTDAPGEGAPLDGTLGTYGYWPAYNPPEYGDANGWLDDSTGSTISFRHLSPSGALTVCGRGYYGMRCGPPTAATWWTTTEFTTPAGWNSSSTYYGSIRLADVNGDGYADVCGRNEAGVRCLTGNGASFANDTVWTTQYGAGWSFSQYGETLQFGDIDGDGRDDVCGRGSYGMSCSVAASTSSFVEVHNWSMNVNNTGLTANTVDFGDSDPVGAWNAYAGRYRSIRLVDINRDGYVDVCGRDYSGIYCALSTGTAFEAKRNVMPFNFGGSTWDSEQYGSTVTFGNLDGDARVDLCVRGISGMMCSEGP